MECDLGLIIILSTVMIITIYHCTYYRYTVQQPLAFLNSPTSSQCRFV